MSGWLRETGWRALERKGLVSQEYPVAIRLKPEAVAYETRMAEAIFLGADH